MSNIISEISDFLKSNDCTCEHELFHGVDGLSVRALTGICKNILVPQIDSTCPEDAGVQAQLVAECIEDLCKEDNEYPLIISQDRWYTQGRMMRARLLAHLEIYTPIYARNCEVKKISKDVAKQFLQENHSYGHAACRYCYGMFFKRHTGHLAGKVTIQSGTLVAVATFSNARKWIKGEKTIRSYEWTRYASLPDVRLSGGMGKMLKAFIKEVQPDDIMSYADLEWSAGDVYAQLGFELEGVKSPVMFSVDTTTWQRFPFKAETPGNKYFQNFGSNKYRLKLTDYK